MKYAGMPMGMWVLFAGSFQKQLTAVLGYDAATAKAITKKAKPQYRQIICRLPEFEKADRFKMNIVNCALLAAFVLSMPERPDVERVLRDYGIPETLRDFSELQRYHYERYDPDSREVRLILRLRLEGRAPLVLRFKNEEDVTQALLESQCRFAQTLRENGIPTPRQYRAESCFTRWYRIGGYEVLAALEDFAEGQITVVDAAAAEQTGALLARTHRIAETLDLHVENRVLFDPFAENDLFDVEGFRSVGPALSGEDKVLFDRILAKYDAVMDRLAPLRQAPRYAVQGDISDCNLYRTPSGEIGLFDFNRCGDNVLFCDAVMQALFEARLMDYPEELGPEREPRILAAFWRGYRSQRSVSPEEERLLPALCAVIRAFWSMDIRWREDSLLNAHENGDLPTVRRRLRETWHHLSALP